MWESIQISSIAAALAICVCFLINSCERNNAVELKEKTAQMEIQSKTNPPVQVQRFEIVTIPPEKQVK